jgi:putative hydrolase of the HAD superfamily
MFDTIVFDADDTLWENEIYYRRSKEQFIDLLTLYTGDREVVGNRLDEIEVNNVEIYGYGIKSFTLSMLEAAIELSQGRIQADGLDKIISLGRQMLATRVQLFPHSVGVLQELAKDWRLMLITKGDVFEQSLKIERTGLIDYFRHIEIVGTKNAATYRTIFERYRIDPLQIVMVGNSLRSDILPILELGGKAVYIPYEFTWFHEHIDDQEISHDGYHELDNLQQLPAFIRQLVQNEGDI